MNVAGMIPLFLTPYRQVAGVEDNLVTIIGNNNVTQGKSVK